MKDFLETCDICGEKYDAYMRTFWVQCSSDNKDQKCCCPKCWSEQAELKPHRYTNHIPTFCDGGDLITRLFDTKEELISWLRENLNIKDNEELCCSNDGNIITVNKDKKFWWVHGYSTLKKGDLPYWKETAEKYYGEKI